MNQSKLSMIWMVMLASVFAGCASAVSPGSIARTAPTPFYTITVNFDADNCPTSVTPPPQVGCPLVGGGICVESGRAVQWVSNPVGTAFEVYFDPFVGRPYGSNGPNETTTPVVVRRDAMPGLYKYSILGVVCSGTNAVLDPAFRVDD